VKIYAWWTLKMNGREGNTKAIVIKDEAIKERKQE
jgi:hypothetical protein